MGCVRWRGGRKEKVERKKEESGRKNRSVSFIVLKTQHIDAFNIKWKPKPFLLKLYLNPIFPRTFRKRMILITNTHTHTIKVLRQDIQII